MSQLAMFENYAQERPKMPPEPIARAAHIEGDYRYSLSRRWSAGDIAAFAMLNPSTADARIDDPTIKRCMGFAWRWGYAGIVVVNRYPFRSPSPAALRKWLQGMAPRGPDHDALLGLVTNARRCAEALDTASLHIAAWGNSDIGEGPEEWLEAMEDDLDQTVRWHCLGTNVDGSPKHPLARGRNRMSDDARPILWRASP